MQKKHIITISGKPGSGKSSTADKVAELLSYTRHSSGDMVRTILKEKGMTLEKYNAEAEDDHDLDALVDERLRALRDMEDIVVDSRLGFYWLPESFKVYLDLDLSVATARIYKDTVSNSRRSGEDASSLDEVARMVEKRVSSERNRFKAMYNVDPYNRSHFDLIIDTSNHSPQTVALTVFDTYKQWLNTDTWKQVNSSVPLGYSFKNQY
ncbi:cytidylate kinase family protein [Patescibacteria group bacterium]|nr:cytidylate kinase family protein [Patescibacteria group bacterium]